MPISLAQATKRSRRLSAVEIDVARPDEVEGRRPDGPAVVRYRGQGRGQVVEHAQPADADVAATDEDRERQQQAQQDDEDELELAEVIDDFVHCRLRQRGCAGALMRQGGNHNQK